jgi:uncharacterized protein (TIGR02646 family)
MSGHIPAALVRQVIDRAGNLCEYCRLPQATQEATFHVDHVQPRSLEGPTSLHNLALSCVTCSLKKAARTLAVDPQSQEETRLFNPRTDIWNDHFEFATDGEIVAKTRVARATISLLAMNRPAIVLIRRELAILGRFPPT